MYSVISNKEIRSEVKTVKVLGRESLCPIDMFHIHFMHSLKFTDEEYNQFLDFMDEKEKNYDYLFDGNLDFKCKRDLMNLRSEFIELKKDQK